MAAVFIFSTCNKDNASLTNTVKTLDVKEGSGKVSIDVVKLELWDASLCKSVAIAEGAYSKGVKIALPDNVDSKFLVAFNQGVIKGATISDQNAKVALAELTAYKGGVEAGAFYYGRETDQYLAKATLLYTDRDVSITGSSSEKDGDETEIFSYSVYLKKGWNWMYSIEEESANGKKYSVKLTTSKPSAFKWVFYD